MHHINRRCALLPWRAALPYLNLAALTVSDEKIRIDQVVVSSERYAMKLSSSSTILCLTTTIVGSGHAFMTTPPTNHPSQRIDLVTMTKMQRNKNDNDEGNNRSSTINEFLGASLAVAISFAGAFGGSPVAFAADKAYDGFAEYAKENQMEKSDVGCFVAKCGDQTKNLFSNPRGIKVCMYMLWMV